MKISNSKKQLAKIISENGGWREGAEFSAQDRLHALVDFYEGRPRRDKDDDYWHLPGGRLKAETFEAKNVIANWHQTILSRDEYFHLYPAPDADGWIEWKGGECPVERGTLIDVRHRNKEEYIGVPALGRWNYVWFRSGIYPDDIIAYRPHKPEQSKSTAVGDDETNLAAKEELEALELSESPEQRAKLAKIYAPSIEQLAADYKAKLAIAQQAQEEADSHRCGAEAALEKLVAAGKAHGLVLSVAAPEPELVISDWRDLQEGDEIRCPDYEGAQSSGCVFAIDARDGSQPIKLKHPDGTYTWPANWEFIRRPAKGNANA